LVAPVADATKFTLPLLSALMVAVTVKLVGAGFKTGTSPFEQAQKDDTLVNKINSEEVNRTF
jgi:hypothetical protein